MNNGNFFVYITPLLSLLFLTAVPTCFAADSQLENEIAAYNKGDFEQAIDIGGELIRKDPKNATAHYYLADSYCQLKQFNQAIKEYSYCIKLGKDSKIASYSKRALAVLNSSSDSRPNSETISSDTNKVQTQVDTVREQYAREEQEELDRAQTHADAQIEEVKRVQTMKWMRCLDMFKVRHLAIQWKMPIMLILLGKFGTKKKLE